jgi:MGT family glycosyltransferase
MTGQDGTDKTVSLFANIGTGHLNPMLALAQRLTALGWTVLFYAHANARDRVSSTGAVWRNYGSDDWDLFATARRATKDLLQMEPDALLDMSIVSSGLPATLAMLPYLLDEIQRHQPLFTVHDAAATWGALAGVMSGRPTVCSMSAFPLRAEQAAETYPPGPIQKAAARSLQQHYGVRYDPAEGYTNYTEFNMIFTARHWAGDRYANPTHHFCGPTPFAQTAEAMQHPAVQIAKAAQAAGKKVVYASCGTVVSGTLNAYYEGTMHHLFAEAIEALRDREDVQLIVSAGRRAATDTGTRRVMPGTGDPLPDFVHWFEYTPQPQVLEHADLFLTHAGMNSTNEAAWFGVPVVCCPFFGDGVLNARRFVELGVGITVDYRIATPTQVAAGESPFSKVPPSAMRSALDSVLDDPSHRQAARSLRDEFRGERNLDRNIDAMLQWAMQPERV